MKQRFKPNQRVLQFMELFRRMTNDCIRIGLTEGRTSLRSLSLACYPKLKSYDTPAAYKLCAISKAAGILTNHKKLSKKHHVKQPYCSRPNLITCYGLKTVNGILRMPGNIEIPLNSEAMVQEPPRRVILKVDADQSTAKLIHEPTS